MVSNITKLVATVRIEKYNGKAALFYYDERKQLTCYSRDEGHCLCDIGYYLNKTRPVQINEKSLVEEFIKRYENSDNDKIKVILKKRISLYDNVN